MAKNITVGIDIGTYRIKVVVTENLNDDKYLPKIIGAGFSESKGMRHGYITNPQDVIDALNKAIKQAEKTSGVKIKNAYISTGGIGLSGIISEGSVIVSRADSQITDFEIEKVTEISESEIPTSISLNKKIINSIPLSYKIDGRPVLGNPVGMKGMKLETKTLFIACLEQHLNDLIETVEENNIEVVDIVASPIAGSLVTLNKTQKIAGCVLVNIGAETTSAVVFENNIPISLEVFPVGSTDITNDIALGLKISLEEAEKIKIEGITSTSYPKKKLEEIINARLTDMFELIESHLKKINKSELLPAGIIITGGGSNMENIEDFAKNFLKLPAKTAGLGLKDGEGKIKDPSWSTSYGLCVLGMSSGYNNDTIVNSRLIKKTRINVLKWIKQFLP